MALYLENLDARTRQLMLEEMNYDIAHNQLHISPVLSGQGQRDYPNLLREAIENGNEETLAQSLREHRHLLRSTQKRRPSGGYTIATVPATAAETLAEGEFNRFYIRALCRRALKDGIMQLVVRQS